MGRNISHSRASFATLWRHEWRLNGRGVWGIIALQYALSVLHVLLGLIPEIENSVGTAIINTAHVAAVIVQLVSVVIVAVLVLLSYYRSMHGQYAHFTVSTPVVAGKHLAVKVLWAWLALAVSILGAVLGTAMGTIEVQARSMSASAVPELASLSAIADVLREAPLGVGLGVVIGAIVLLQYVCEGVFIVTTAYSERFSRLGRAGGIIVAVVLGWLIRNVMVILAFFAVPLQVLFTGARSLISDVEISAFPWGTLSFENAIPFGWLIGELLVIGIYWWITRHELTRHWSL
ncbi:MAG: hypothetical protein PUK40_00285 [Actinomycetaceae bacterium]|nr:hypothetical protein [Arcanobacterium sp.]MDD7504378.1 hypothetical protein [Actinomycetaceae bacterium]MDY6143042.1 hypothetical protein [Arcanobacterium sp.]